MTRLSFKPIFPKKMNVKVYVKTLTKAAEAEAKVHRRLLDKTIVGWTDPPRFVTDVIKGPGPKDVSWFTHPAGTEEQVENWERVNLGTRPHRISARRAPTLRFRTGYRARTRPKKLTSGRSSRFGPWVTPKSVKHPGIKAREFTKTVTEKRKKPYERRMKFAMAWAAVRTFF